MGSMEEKAITDNSTVIGFETSPQEDQRQIPPAQIGIKKETVVNYSSPGQDLKPLCF